MKHQTEQAVVYRVYTEDTDTRPEVANLVSEYFNGFTMFSGIGFWRGKKELSLVIEIIADYNDKHKVLRLAGEIKELNKQESVLVFTTTGLENLID